MSKLTIQTLELEGKTVLMRVDFNVPLLSNGTIADPTRLKESLPSIEWVLKHKGRLILMSHLGRPQGKRDPQLSLAPCAKALSQLLHRPVLMAKDCIGPEVKTQAASLKEGEILLLENLRFHPAEENPTADPSFAQELASLADCYVNDAFASSHRAHASTLSVPALFPHTAAAGFLVQKELQFLGEALNHPQRPFYAIIGGAKISSKIAILKTLAPKTDGLFIGGAMALPFYQAQGLPIGNAPCNATHVEKALQLLTLCAEKKIPIWLPTDLVIADALSNDAYHKTISASGGIPSGWYGVDIGPQTCQEWASLLKRAKTLFWNGPVGICELPSFAQGTRYLARALAQLQAVTVVGGGDSICAINQEGLGGHFTHLSTGGGASLEYVQQGHLPGIDALSNK